MARVTLLRPDGVQQTFDGILVGHHTMGIISLLCIDAIHAWLMCSTLGAVHAPDVTLGLDRVSLEMMPISCPRPSQPPHLSSLPPPPLLGRG